MYSIQKKEKKHFNAVDVLLIIVLIAFLAFAANIVISDVFNKNDAKIQYVIKITGVDEQHLSDIETGFKVSEGNTNAYIGTACEIKSVPSVITAFNYEKDKFISSYSSGNFDLYITVNASAAVEDNRFIVNGVTICANTNPEISVPFKYEKAAIVFVKEQTEVKEKK